MTQDGKGLLCDNYPLQIMLRMLDDSWCAETFLLKKTIPSSCFGEYKCCYLIWNHQIHVLIIVSCVKTLHVLQNQSFFSFAPAVCVFLVTLSCRLLIIISIRWLLNSFCMISFRWTSWYVLIDVSSLTHFLCRNLFVMSWLILSAYSDFHECFGNSLFHHWQFLRTDL